jgi:hypothetical protein
MNFGMKCHVPGFIYITEKLAIMFSETWELICNLSKQKRP